MGPVERLVRPRRFRSQQLAKLRATDEGSIGFKNESRAAVDESDGAGGNWFQRAKTTTLGVADVAIWDFAFANCMDCGSMCVRGLTFELTGPLRCVGTWATVFVAQMAAHRNGSG